VLPQTAKPVGTLSSNWMTWLIAPSSMMRNTRLWWPSTMRNPPRNAPSVFQKVIRQHVELFCFACRELFRPHFGQCLLQNRHRPTALEDAVGSQRIRRLAMIPFLGPVCIETDYFFAAASLLRQGAVPLIGQKMLQRREEKGTEPPFLRIGLPDDLLVEDESEERLRQILRIFGRVALTPHVGVERIPIRAAKLLQSFLCGGG